MRAHEGGELRLDFAGEKYSFKQRGPSNGDGWVSFSFTHTTACVVICHIDKSVLNVPTFYQKGKDICIRKCEVCGLDRGCSNWASNMGVGSC